MRVLHEFPTSILRSRGVSWGERLLGNKPERIQHVLEISHGGPPFEILLTRVWNHDAMRLAARWDLQLSPDESALGVRLAGGDGWMVVDLDQPPVLYRHDLVHEISARAPVLKTLTASAERPEVIIDSGIVGWSTLESERVGAIRYACAHRQDPELARHCPP